jgi:hypothetical protein
LIEAKDEPHARVGTPAIQMLGLTEVGVATQQHFAEAAVQTNLHRAIDFRRGAFMRRPIAGTIEHAQDLARVGQRHHERMVTPDAVVGDVHTDLALAGRLHERAIHVDACQFEEYRRLPSPDTLPNVIADVDQGMHVRSAETSAEIAGGRRIRNALSTEGIEVDFILATQFQILQASAVAQRVVGQVEHVIGFVVGQMDLEQVQLFVDGIGEANAPRQKMDGADAAVSQAARAVSDLVLDVAGSEHRLVQVAELLFIESAFNSALAVGQLLVYLGIHSKSLSVRFDVGVDTSSDVAESQRISSFFSYFPRRRMASSLDQGLARRA